MIARAKKQCSVKGCTRDANASRGMCLTCYQTAYRAVSCGKTTWAAMERAKIIPPRKTAASPITKALKALSKQ